MSTHTYKQFTSVDMNMLMLKRIASAVSFIIHRIYEGDFVYTFDLADIM